MLTMEISRLIERCRQGDAEALGELYKVYAKQMRSVCRRYISDEQTVEDVLHDAFVIIFTSFDRLRDVQRAEAWMTAITRNVASKCKNHLEALPTVSLEDANGAELIATETEERDVRGVPLSEVVRMIGRLPEGYGKVFRLSVFEGLSHKEIAAMLGIEPHSSSSQLARAKKMLRKMMQQYWVAGLLLLLVPLTFLLFRKEDAAVTRGDRPVVENQGIAEGEENGKPQPLPVEPHKEGTPEPAIAGLPKHRVLAGSVDTLRSVIAQVSDSVASDTLSNLVVSEPIIPDSSKADTSTLIRSGELLQYDMAGLLPDSPDAGVKNGGKWFFELAYAGQLDEQNRYNQPFSYKPAPSDAQSLPSGQEPTIPSSIDNWTDYAAYLANNQDAVSEKTRSVIMRIALNNASRPGEDKILRTSRHRMPVTWSLAMKYRLTDRLGLESGFSYSRLVSDFEMGSDGNVIREHQTVNYLGIPVKGIYNMYGTKRWNLYGSLGLTTEIPVRSTLHSDYFVNGSYEVGDRASIRAPWQFSPALGLGLQIHLTPAVGFFVEPSLQYYIPMKSDIETYRTEHPFTFSLPLGIRFTW